MRTILTAVALATTLHAGATLAQTSANGATERQRDDDRERRFRELDGFRRAPSGAAARSAEHGYQGMYFRPDVGFGYMSVKLGSEKYTGAAGSFGLHFGGALAPDVLLGVHFHEAFMANPTASGSAAGTDTSGSTIAIAAIGPELTVGLPADFYWAATIALTRVASAQDNGAGTSTGASKAGFGAKLALGYDHWARSGKWALGAALQASYSRNQDQGADPGMLNSWMAGLAVSATWD